jgi:CO/xanthine dehydrogenase Mo-binding subunit
MPDDRTDFKIVGKRDVPGALSYVLATGQAKFPRDLVLPNMLFAKVFRSPFARAKIKSMDVSQAKALPGVKAVITWEDPELKAMPLVYAGTKCPVLGNQADREGDEVGFMVAAETEELCDEALKLVKIDWEVQPHIVDTMDAIKPDAPALHPDAKPTNVDLVDNWEDGNVEAGFRQSAHVIEFDYTTPLTTTYHSMPIATVAKWEQVDSGTQGPTLFLPPMYRDRALVRAREAFKLSWDKVLPISQYCGAPFCDSDPRRVTRLVPLLAKRTGRPVRLAYTRRENFDTTGSTGTTHCKIGFNDDGMIIAAYGKTVASSGVEADIERQTQNMTAFRMLKIRNIKNETTYVYANTTRQANLQGYPASSDLMNMAIGRVADALGMDPVDVMLKNVFASEPSAKLCADQGKAAIGWQWHPAGTKKLANGRMHGFGHRMWYHHGWGTSASITLNLKEGGKILMPFGSAYFGVNGQDAMAMVVAEEIGAKLEDVIPEVDPHSPNTYVTGGSGFATIAWVAYQAAMELKSKILTVAARTLKVNPEDLDTKDSTVYVKADPTKNVPFSSLVNSGVGSGSGLAIGLLGHHQGAKPSNATETIQQKMACMNSNFAEVEVDTETGQVIITKMVVASDAGKVIRPSSYEGQMEGRMIWNISHGIAEEYIYDKASGVLLNGSALEYKPSTILDVLPAVKTVTVETRGGGGMYGSVGVGESTWNYSALSLAVQNAIGKWIDPPITPDKVLKALGKA